MFCVRVKEQIILIDAVKDLLNHVCTEADKTTISDFVKCFTSSVSQSHNKTVATAGDATSAATVSTDDKMIVSSPKKMLTSDPCFSDENKNATTGTTCRAEEVDTKDAEVAAADTAQPVADAVKEERAWKLFIRVHSRLKNVPPK